MRGKRRKGLVLLGLILVLCLSGCGKKQVEDTVNIRVGSLKGPTSLGLLGLIEQEKEEAQSRSERKRAQLAFRWLSLSVSNFSRGAGAPREARTEEAGSLADARAERAWKGAEERFLEKEAAEREQLEEFERRRSIGAL